MTNLIKAFININFNAKLKCTIFLHPVRMQERRRCVAATAADFF